MPAPSGGTSIRPPCTSRPSCVARGCSPISGRSSCAPAIIPGARRWINFIVHEPSSAQTVGWGAVNRPFEPHAFDLLHHRALAYLQGKDLFVQDCFAGADPAYRLPIRIVTETAWHSLFAHTMFLQPTPNELRTHTPQFTVLNMPEFHAVPEVDGTHSRRSSARVSRRFRCTWAVRPRLTSRSRASTKPMDPQAPRYPRHRDSGDALCRRCHIPWRERLSCQRSRRGVDPDSRSAGDEAGD